MNLYGLAASDSYSICGIDFCSPYWSHNSFRGGTIRIDLDEGVVVVHVMDARPSLRRQRLSRTSTPADPVLQLFVFHDAFWLDHHPIPHRPAGDVESSDVRLQKRIFALIWTEAGDQGVLQTPARAFCRLEKSNASKHLFSSMFFCGPGVTDALARDSSNAIDHSSTRVNAAI